MPSLEEIENRKLDYYDKVLSYLRGTLASFENSILDKDVEFYLSSEIQRVSSERSRVFKLLNEKKNFKSNRLLELLT